MSAFKDMVGVRVGSLVVVERAPNLGTSTRWKCSCDCGGISVVHSSALRKKNNPTDNCGCLRYKRYKEKRSTHGLSGTPIACMFDHAKSRAKRRGLDFNLEIEDIIIPPVCPYLGIPLKHSKGRQTAFSPSLDRINPSLGYVKGNVEIISYRANAIKHDATFEEFEKMYFSWKERYA